MTERSIIVRLQADIGDLRTQLRAVEQAIRDVSDAEDDVADSATFASDKMAESAMSGAEAYDAIAVSLLAVGGAAAAGFAVAVNAYSEFDETMSAVQAATSASAAGMAGLSDAALKAGADTSFSATEAADAVTQLAKAGLSSADILGGGLTGALDLAAAGELDVAEAAEIAATAMSQFELTGQDVTHIADLLAAGAGKAQGEVTDLGAALKFAGVPAAGLGISIEETTGTLALFAKNGLIGEQAGTSFRSMILSLTSPSALAADEMERLGINVFDASGEFVGMSGVAGTLQQQLGSLTQAERSQTLGRIFGNESQQAANVLFREGAQGVDEWTAAVDDSGFAAEQARAKTDNLRGDLERLSGAWETALIKTGKGADGPLRGVVQRLDAIVSAYANAGDGAQTATRWMLGTAAVVGLVGGTAMLAVPKIIAFHTALAAMGPAGAKAAAGLVAVRTALIGPWGIALAGAAIVLGAWANEQYKAAQYVAELTASLDQQTGAITDSTREIVKNDLAATDGWWVFRKDSTFDAAEKLGLDLAMVTDAAAGNADAMAQLNEQLDELDAKTEGGDPPENLVELELAIDRVREGVDGNNASLGVAADRNRQFAEAGEEAAAAEGEVAEATAAATVTVDEQTAAIEKWQQELQGVAEAFVDPLSIYTGLLGEKQAAEEASAQATADSTASSTDSWEDYVGQATVSMDEYAAKLEEQIEAQEAWAENLTTVAGRAGYDVAQILAQMGAEGVQLTADMANGTDAEVQRMGDLLRRDTQNAAGGVVTELDQGMKIAAAVGRAGAMGTAEAISKELGIGVAEVAAIAVKYGIKLAAGINPILKSLGKKTVAVYTGDGRMVPHGGVGFEADGGIEDHTAQIAPAGAWRVWAEDETGGESYIPLAPSKRPRSKDIWRETGKRLGIDFEEYAFGGVNDVPRPPSTAPKRIPISTAGDATMDTEYDSTVEWLKEHAAPNLGAGIGWKAMMAALRGQFPGLQLISGYRPGAITATGNPSYHGKGRAVDIPPRLDVNRWIYDKYKAQTKELIFSVAGAKQIHNGSDHVYTGITRAMHYCVPLSVKVLTRRGWVSHDEIRDGDETPGFNPATEQTEWTRILDVNTFDGAEVIETGSRSWSVQATADHRWIARHPITGAYHWTTTASRKQAPWVVAAPLADGPGLALTDDEAELLGWLLTDGSQWEGSDPCRFNGCGNTATGYGLCGSHRRQERAGKPLAALRVHAHAQRPGFSLFAWQTKPAGVKRLGQILGDEASWNGKGYRLHDTYARDLLARAGLTNIKDAAQLLVMAGRMTGGQRKALLDGVIGGDGTAAGRRILQNAGPLCEFIATLAYYCGHRPRVVKRRMGDDGWKRNGVPCEVSLSRPRASTYRRVPRSLGTMPVWCPTTELGSWTAQFGDNPVLTGNSHNHWAMADGGILNPHIRDRGGPLLPGFTYNATGGTEYVLPHAPATTGAAGSTAEEHTHFHLDSAAAARQASEYVREVNAAASRRASLRSRVR